MISLIQIPGTGLAHFHGLTFVRWLAKWGFDPAYLRGMPVLKRQPHARAIIAYVHRCLEVGDLDKLSAVFRELYVFDTPQRFAEATMAGHVITRDPLFRD